MLMKLPKNIIFILKRMAFNIGIVVLFLSIPIYIFNPLYLNSLLLGVVFSYFIFYQFSYAQASFLFSQKKGALFLNYFLRLLFYAIPMGIGLFYKNYFNFVIILVPLFFFQFYYIWIEFFRSLRKVRRQNK